MRYYVYNSKKNINFAAWKRIINLYNINQIMNYLKTVFVTLGVVLACSVAANAQTSDAETVAMADASAAESSIAESDASESHVHVWPEVSSIKIMVDVEKTDTVQIYNAMGRLVKTQRVEKGQGVNIETLIPGLYTVKVGGKTGAFTKE